MSAATMTDAERTERLNELASEVEQASRKANVLARVCADAVNAGAKRRALDYAERFRSADQRERELRERLREVLDTFTT